MLSTNQGNKTNLLDLFRKNKNSEKNEKQQKTPPITPPIIKNKTRDEIRKYLIQNPKTNLITLFKKKKEEETTPCVKQKLLKFYDSQGRSSILSPISAANNAPQKSVSEESTNALQGLNNSMKISIPKRQPSTNKLQRLHSQTSILESPNEAESFIIGGSNASKLDIEEHLLRIENIDNHRITRSQSQCQDQAQFLGASPTMSNTLSVPQGKGPRRLQSFSVGEPFSINTAEQRQSVRLRRGLSGIHQPKETSILERSKDEAGRKKMNNFVILQELGRGAFGKVRLVYNELDQQYYAMKIADKNKLKRKLLTKETSAYTLLAQEIAILKKVDHQNIVKLIEVIDDPEERKLYLIMEHVKKGSINSKQYWKAEGVKIDWDEGEKPPKISLLKIRKYLRQFLLGLDYLHNFARIIHRDIKPDNLLIDDNDNLKIADFGVSQMYDNSTTELIQGDVGTKAFLSPEAFKNSQFKGKPADIWATGITFYILTQGVHPFQSKNVQQLKDAVFNKEVQYNQDTNLELIDFLNCCLKKDSRQRYTLEQLMDHPFITNHGEEPVLEQEYEENFFISENEVSKAISKVTLRATVRVFAKLKQKLNQSRQRIQKMQ